MELNNFLKLLKEYKTVTNKQEEIDILIIDVIDLLKEIHQDHIQGDVDDQERN